MERTLLWLLGATIVSIASAFAYQEGALHYIYGSDVTRLSIVITLIFIYKTLMVGVHTMLFEREISRGPGLSGVCEIEFKIAQEIRALDFWQDTCVRFGLIGTLIGFVFISKDLIALLDTLDYSARDASKILAPGNGVALMTSLTGMVAAVLLNFQKRNLEFFKSRPRNVLR